MIQVVIEMDDSLSALNIRAVAPPPVVLAVITAAYHEMLSKKVQQDIKDSRQVVEAHVVDMQDAAKRIVR